MPHCLSTTICSPFIGGLAQTASRSKFRHRGVSKPPSVPIHNLDDDSLLSIFDLCRLDAFVKNEYVGIVWCNWNRERWWYALAKVCRRWRYLLLGSASHLRLCLVCTPGTPVADMLAHSPPLPLIIDHEDKYFDLTAEDEEGIMFALQHRDRVRRIYLTKPIPSLQKLIKAMDNQFPMLEYLYISSLPNQDAPLILPSTFEAPRLRRLVLDHFVSPIGAPLLTASVSLVSLSLRWIHPSTNVHPNHLFRTLSLLPQLQNLAISFSSPVPNREIERQLLRMPIITHTTLPNLRTFNFGGVSAYLEALLPHMNAPLLNRLDVHFFNQLNFSVPHLHLIISTVIAASGKVEFVFYHDAVAVFMFLSVSDPFLALVIRVGCGHLDWQVSSMAQIFNVLDPLFATVVDLTLNYRSHTLSSELHNQADPTQWHQLLGSFRNVETLRVHDGLVGELSHCLALDEEPPSEILPKLKTLVCRIGSRDARTFAKLLDDREVAGLPINLVEDNFPAGYAYYGFAIAAGAENIGLP